VSQFSANPETTVLIDLLVDANKKETLGVTGDSPATFDLSTTPLQKLPIVPGTVRIVVRVEGLGTAAITDDGHGALVGERRSLPRGGTINYETGEMTGVTAVLQATLLVVAEPSHVELSYEDLSLAIGTDVQTKPGYGYLLTARKRVQKDEGDVWKTRKGVGLYLVPHGERARWGTDVSRRKMASAAKRGAEIMETTNIAACSDSEIQALNTGGIMMSMFRHIASNRTVKRLKAAVTPTPDANTRMSLADRFKLLGLKGEKVDPDQPT
jgi:hypothetical protein